MPMSNSLQVGDHVAWRWGFGVAEGVVSEVLPEKTTIQSKGKFITRNGTPENLAIIITHKSGNPVLKLQSELIKSGYAASNVGG